MDENPHLMLGAYAVDAVDHEERAAFELHLKGCADCRAELVGLQAAAAALGAAEAVRPPERLRAAVLDQVALTPQTPATPPTAADELVVGAATSSAATGAVGNGGRSGWRASRVLAVAAAVLVVVAVALGALLVQARSDRDRLAADAQAVTEVLTAPDAQTVTGAVTGGGRASVVVSDTEHSAVFVGSGLEPPPSGHVYQLWFITAGGAAASAGTFTPAADGSAARVLQGSPAGAATVGLTVEPDPGSSQPTTTPVLAFPLTG